jgi:hypothetical protein
MTWWLWCGVVVGVLAVVALGLRALGSQQWGGRMAALRHGLGAGPGQAREQVREQDQQSSIRKPPTQYDVRELEGLPAPVQRYFCAVLKQGQPMVRTVTIKVIGSINMSPTAEQWKPFTSTQRVVTSQGGGRPGFMWDARISMLPGMQVHVVDSYVAGTGLVRAALWGLFTVADVKGGG